MTDPGTLRTQAMQLREAARSMRSTGFALDDEVGEIQQRYPLPSRELWQGPNADTYATALTAVKDELARLGRDVDRYADECEDLARSKDSAAELLELQAQPYA